MSEPSTLVKQEVAVQEALKCLSPELVSRIDEAVCRVGPFGEVRLVIIRGVLRFIQITVSESVSEPKKGDEAHDQTFSGDPGLE